MHHFFMLNLMVHIVTILSFTGLNKFLCNTFTGNPMNLQPNVLSVRPMCKLLLLSLLLLLLSSSFTNAVQITVSTTNVIKGTQPQLHRVCHKKNTDSPFTNSSTIYHIHFTPSHHLSHVNGKSTVRPITGNDDAQGK